MISIRRWQAVSSELFLTDDELVEDFNVTRKKKKKKKQQRKG